MAKKSSKINEEIIIRSQARDIEAFEQLVSYYERKVYFFCLRYVGIREDAEDITQEIFFKTFKNIKRFDFSTSFSTWLFTISKNTVYDFLRKKRRYKAMFIETDINILESKAKLSWDKTNKISAKVDVENALAKIKPQHRQVIKLFYWGGLPYKDISQKMKMPINTVKTQISRAKKSLSLYLKNEKTEK